jgi:phage terminase small subunit
MEMKRLTPKDRLFCFELLADEKMNPENAALKVGYSKSVAASKAYSWVSNSKDNPKPQVKAFFDQLLSKREKNLELSASRIEDELCKIGFSNITDIIQQMGGHINLQLIKNLKEDERVAISEITESEFQGVTTRTIKLHSKLKALELLLKRIPGGKKGKNIVIQIIKDGEVIEERVKKEG